MAKIYTELTVNFGSVRKTESHGRQYYVAPLTMIVPGVLAGSKGPLLYTAAEIKNSMKKWEGVPITLNHPQSAETRVTIGVVKRPRVTANGALKADAYIDIERSQAADPRIVEILDSNQKLEVSTGLYTRNEEFQGDYNGKEYVAIARNYVPDHLAVLPDAIGACSIHDGCGLNVNKCSCQKDDTSHRENTMKDLVKKVIENSNGLYTTADAEVLEKFSEDRLNGMLGTFAKNKVEPPAPPKKKVPKRKVENRGPEDDEVEDGDGDDDEVGKKRTHNIQSEIKKYMKGLSAEDFYDLAPAEVQEVLSTAKRTHNERKAELISALTAHCTTEEMRDGLAQNFAKKDIEELELLANAFTRPERSNDNPFAVNFVGNAGSPRMTSTEMTKKDRDDYLPLPTMNWSEEPATA